MGYTIQIRHACVRHVNWPPCYEWTLLFAPVCLLTIQIFVNAVGVNRVCRVSNIYFSACIELLYIYCTPLAIIKVHRVLHGYWFQVHLSLHSDRGDLNYYPSVFIPWYRFLDDDIVQRTLYVRDFALSAFFWYNSFHLNFIEIVVWLSSSQTPLDNSPTKTVHSFSVLN